MSWGINMGNSESQQRLEVIEQALSWIGTPYIHAADVKGAGIDCAMLLVRCFVDSGILPAFDPRPYPRDWHLHHSEERYLAWLQKSAQEIPFEDKRPGDVLVYKFGRCYSHGAIFLGGRRLIHACVIDPACSLGDIFDSRLTCDMFGRLRPVKVFNVWANTAENRGNI